MNKNVVASLTPEQWEALCDRCGKCCLVTLQDEDTGDIYHTNILCRHCDIENHQCRVYANRFEQVPACLKLTPENIDKLPWLPKTCAYRRLFDENYQTEPCQPLNGRVVSQDDVDEADLENYIVDWDDL